MPGVPGWCRVPRFYSRRMPSRLARRGAAFFRGRPRMYGCPTPIVPAPCRGRLSSTSTAEAEGGVARFAIRPTAIHPPHRQNGRNAIGRRLGRHVMRRLATSPGACAPLREAEASDLAEDGVAGEAAAEFQGDGLGAPPFGPQALQQIDTGLGPCGHGGLLRRAPMARPTAPFLRPFRRQHEEGPEAQRARALQISPSDQNGMSSLRS